MGEMGGTLCWRNSGRQQLEQAGYLDCEVVTLSRQRLISAAALAEAVGGGGDLRSEAGTGCGFGHGVSTYCGEVVAQPAKLISTSVSSDADNRLGGLGFLVGMVCLRLLGGFSGADLVRALQD